MSDTTNLSQNAKQKKNSLKAGIRKSKHRSISSG